ncbi:MAG: hypothetical protein COB02_18065 [Candidatus Cloacimonadota bacterium]|nr:MAG: hypothetical protein COB02_18065 [Candidatus Cloacimonadota bacterium]
MNKDDPLMDIFLAMSDKHLTQYSELPLAIQEKLKEKFLLIANSVIQAPPKKEKQVKESSSDTQNQLVPSLSSCPFSDNITFLDANSIKFEITSTRESMFSGIGCFSVIAFLFFAFQTQFIIAFICFAAIVGAVYLSSITDDYILYDNKKKKLINHRQLGTTINLIDLAPHRYIKAFAVQGKKCSDKSNSWWEYQAIAVTIDGDFIQLSDFYKDAFFEIKVNLREISQFLNIEFLNYAIAESTLEVYGSGRQMQLVYSD